MISFAQNSEDILLYRCFRDVATGFYVDVGAFHPEIASVTKLFYDKGWSGINIEPGQGIAALQAARPRDVNLAVAISDHSGEADFYEHPNDPGTSTLSAEVPRVIAERAGNRQVRRVSLLTLTEVLDAHAPTRHLHFLKVDVEGAETLVIAGLDLKQYRPEVILIESAEPYSTIRHPGPWKDILAAAAYRLAYFDGINDFWVREESTGRLLPEFAVPVNVLDGFTQPDPRVKALEAEHARAADAARFHAESAVTAMALLTAAKVETEAALRAALAAAEARVVRETTARAEYQAKLFRLTETLHLDRGHGPLSLRLVLPLARGIRLLRRLLLRDAAPSAIAELDVDFYRRFYPDLSLFTESEARLHYVTSGCKEGRFPNLKACEQSGVLTELPPQPAECAKTEINARVARDAELSLRLLGSPKSKPGKD